MMRKQFGRSERFSTGRQSETEQSNSCATRPIWSPWGWAVDRRRLVWLIANWCSRNKKCFTCQFRANHRRMRRAVFPLLSRIQNICYELVENGRAAEWHPANHRMPRVAAYAESPQFTLK
jgi:hypothetical protein